MDEWQDLTRLTGGRPLIVERVRLAGSEIAIEGAFRPPSLAALSAEDQVFVAAFVRSHGSIKEMERVFGVSYPTVKNRLNRISARLGFVVPSSGSGTGDVLDRLESGEISAAEATEALKNL